jgi:hypothetical protein
MIKDAQNKLSAEQTVTTGSENGVKSENVIDLGVARRIGDGEDIYLVVQVTTLMAGAGDTMTVDLTTDDNAGLNSATAIQRIGTFPANSAVGTRLVQKLQPGAAYERYLGLLYTAAGSGALEAGAFSAFLTKDVDSLKVYPKGYTIS